MIRFLSIFLFFLFAILVIADSAYEEHLLLEPLPQGSLLASFNFKSNASLQSFEQQHFRYIPRSLGQILQHAKTKELHLRFSSGRWDAETWGTRPWKGAKEGGTGVELWAWIEAEAEEAAFAHWITLNHALSGLFCASLNFVDSTRTTRPLKTFEPTGDHSNPSISNLHLLHGTLPREVVCTENLTPFLKLLPCKGKAGISSLLNGHKLFDASWQTMSIDNRPTESVCINVPNEHKIDTSEGSIERKDPSKNQRCYTLSTSEPFELGLPQQENQAVTPRPLPSIYASRSFTGHGSERGGVQTLLTNPSSTTAISFVYFETLPWFMKPYLHTLKAQTTTSPSPLQNELITSIYYRPALDRQRGTHLELQFTVPPASTVRLTYDFEKAILRYTEYPPDANRGFDVAPAVIRLLPADTNTPVGPSSEVEYVRTTSLLLSLPTPDFSMPYNVIILTSTVMALAFGSIYNLLVRRFVGADEVDGFDLGKLKARVRARLRVLMGRKDDREKKMQ
ncbi:MAG: hypothetical protein Q9222_002686 [Ikaeria aurantiellina]